MRYVDEYIQSNFPKSSQTQAYEIAEELWDLLKALDAKGCIRDKLSGTKRETFVMIERNGDGVLASINKLYEMYTKKERRERFFALTEEFGFSDEDLSHLLHVQMMFAFLLNMEMFKTLLTFVLKNVCPTKTLGTLFAKNGILVEKTLQNGEAQKISKRLDIDLRNSLAHFTFREEGETIYYYDHVKRGENWVLEESRIESADLFSKMREMSLLRTILALVITDWYGL
jgi:hypothetical protein